MRWLTYEEKQKAIIQQLREEAAEARKRIEYLEKACKEYEDELFELKKGY